jgi:iron complex outermembrane receptor protein
MLKRTVLSRELALAFGVFALLSADMAMAQQAPQKIEITGSNIRRVDAETLQPVVVVTREEIERSGKTTLNDVLRELPVVSGGSFSEGTNAGNSFAPGTSAISLRGLGANTSLVLLNGRRIANYGFAQNVNVNFVDLNSIPVNAIERIEILKDGASAIYGSDAITGVVNVILRRDFKGGEVRASYGDSQQGGLQQQRASLTAGVGNLAKDRFNLMATFDYYKQDKLNSQQREFSKNPDNRTQGPGGLDFRSPTGNPGYFTSPGNVRTAFSTCPADRTVAPGSLGVAGSGTICAYDFAPDNDLLPASERIGVLATGTFQLTKQVQLFAELMVNQNETSNSAAPTPAAFALGAAHPDKPNPAVTQVAYRFLDAGLRLSTIESKSERALLGARGSIGAWDFDAAVVASSSRQTNTGYNFIIQERANEAFLGTLAGYTGQFYRVVNPALNPPGMVSAVSISPVRTGDSKLTGIDLRASRELFKLGGGMAAVAVGLDHRKEEVTDSPDPRVDLRNPARVSVAGSGGTFVQGQRSLSSGFAELSLPFAKGLDTQIAVRTDSYSDFGSKTTPKVGMSYKLTPRVLVRAGYSEGFRAPSMAEMYLGDSVSFPNVVDTVRCAAYRNGPLGIDDPRTRAICGVSAGVVGTGVASQVRTTISGNKSLMPETSKSASIGIVMDPVKDLSIAIDIYYIEHFNRILQPTATFVLNNFPNFVTRTAPTADDIAANAPGGLRGVSGDTVSGINQTYFNASRQTTGGTDLEVRYRWMLGTAGRLDLTSSTTYMASLRRQTNPGGPMDHYEGSYDYPTIRNTSTALWSRGPWSTTFGINYIRSMDDARGVAGAAVKVPKFVTYDANVTYRGIKNVSLAVGGRNITNENPPFSNLDWYGYAPGTHSPVGAYWYATARYQF